MNWRVMTSASSAAAHADDALAQAQDEVAETFGNIAEFWGFTRTQGRIFGLLFLSPEPLGHAAIRDRLGISAGSASMTLASLVQWGVIRRRGRQYVAETDLWALITGVMRKREREHVLSAIERIGRALQVVQQARPSAQLRFARERLEHLAGFFELGRSFLDAFVTRSPIHGLLNTIVRRSKKFPSVPKAWDPHVRIGA